MEAAAKEVLQPGFDHVWIWGLPPQEQSSSGAAPIILLTLSWSS